MPVKIRLMRIGAKKRPFFRVVAVDEQKKRTGAYLELLGTYNPLTNPKEIILKQDRIDDWIKKGAQPSDGFLRMTGKAPQRPPRKPKKEQKTAPVAEPVPEAKAAEEPASEEATAPEAQAEAAETPAEQVDAPVTTETSLNEAPMPESAKDASDVILGSEAEPLASGDEATPESNEEVDAGQASTDQDESEKSEQSEKSEPETKEETT